jgi:hypothetical protein
MGLNRVQKRNLAIVLVSQAQQAVDEWETFQKKEYPGVPEGALDDITAEDARQRFAGWLQYLPGKPAAPMLLGDDEPDGEQDEGQPQSADDEDDEEFEDEGEEIVYADS